MFYIVYTNFCGVKTLTLINLKRLNKKFWVWFRKYRFSNDESCAYNKQITVGDSGVYSPFLNYDIAVVESIVININALKIL